MLHLVRHHLVVLQDPRSVLHLLLQPHFVVSHVLQRHRSVLQLLLDCLVPDGLYLFLFRACRPSSEDGRLLLIMFTHQT